MTYFYVHSKRGFNDGTMNYVEIRKSFEIQNFTEKNSTIIIEIKFWNNV